MYKKPEGNLIEHGLVMEYMPYGSLRSLFDIIPDVPWALRFQILHQVALGMNYLHSLDPPIIHRDLKPSNVLLSKHLDVQITDFGLSKIIGATSSITPSNAGTLSYMAPEALKDINYHPTKSYDVYSYGILTWTVFSSEEPYPGINAALIQHFVSEGQRPRDSVLDQYRDVKMVPEAKDLMIKCWNQKAEDRPSFNDCSETTALMFEAYGDEIVDAVRSVQDLLNRISSQDQLSETSGTLYDSTLSMEDFIKALRNDLQTDEKTENSFSADKQIQVKKHKNDKMDRPSKVIHKADDISPAALRNDLQTDEKTENSFSADKQIKVKKHKNDKMDRPSKVIHKADDTSPAEFVMDNIATAIKNSGDFKKIVNKLDNDSILSKDEQKELYSTKSLKDLGNKAGKVILTKSEKNPEAIISFIKKLF
ncbi:receptor-interacting serine/threonine-protein kinase 3-like isoform X1 [Hyla sarda]|uniref:receptor-interacting serine/threonine-protein kinase 3-like isoform X1 n=1 Tax=Hyla sarda TaxID=327740 RepID=UPI0024C36B3E|nr:receptor-interacting serine/threonine-protein kinase 3-like isoform X1 [Hyla sarda]